MLVLRHFQKIIRQNCERTRARGGNWRRFLLYALAYLSIFRAKNQTAFHFSIDSSNAPSLVFKARVLSARAG